jgi:hypothetical protein
MGVRHKGARATARPCQAMSQARPRAGPEIHCSHDLQSKSNRESKTATRQTRD